MRQFAARVGWPLFSIAVAVALWVTFVGSPGLVTSISIPLEYENLPADLEPASELPKSIYVEIQGPSARLRNLDTSGAAAILDFDGVPGPGERTYSIEKRNISLPVGVRVIRTVPAQLRLRFERRLAAQVPINVRFATPPPAGYRVVAEQVLPASLRIIGPESRVKQVQSVETDAIDLSRVIGKAQFRVHTFLADPQVRFVSPPIVQVSLTLEKIVQGGAVSDGKATVRN